MSKHAVHIILTYNHPPAALAGASPDEIRHQFQRLFEGMEELFGLPPPEVQAVNPNRDDYPLHVIYGRIRFAPENEN